MPRLYEDDEKNSSARLILCIVRVTGGRRSLCKFFQEKPGWDALWHDEDENIDLFKVSTTKTPYVNSSGRNQAGMHFGVMM